MIYFAIALSLFLVFNIVSSVIAAVIHCKTYIDYDKFLNLFVYLFFFTILSIGKICLLAWVWVLV